jgi:hypothetical protein
MQKDVDWLSGIERARVLRENADYLGEFSADAADASVVVARRFVEFAVRSLGGGS